MTDQPRELARPLTFQYCVTTDESKAMKFGLHHSSWLESPDPAEAYEAVKAKAQWAEEHGFVWFSVMDHMIQILRVGTPDEPVLEGWTVLAVLAAVTAASVLPPCAPRSVIAIPRISRRSRRASI